MDTIEEQFFGRFVGGCRRWRLETVGYYHLIRAQIRDDPLWDCEHGLASVGRGLD